MLTQEQLEIRKHGVTASEIAAVVGLNPHCPPHDIWARKLGLSEPIETNEAMERGNYLEEALLKWVADREGVIIDTEQKTVIDPEDPLIIATPDGIAFLPTDTANPCAVVEVKSPGPGTVKDWEDPDVVADGIPLYYLPQVQWQMHATGILTEAIVGALVGSRLRTYRVPYAPDLVREMQRQAHEFWDKYVLTRTPPPMNGNPAAAKWIRNFYSVQRSDVMVEVEGATEEKMRAAVKEYEEARLAEREAKDKKNAAAALLQEAIGERAGIVGSDFKVTWKQTKGRTFTDWEALAKQLDPPESMIAQHTGTKPGYRRLYVKNGG